MTQFKFPGLSLAAYRHKITEWIRFYFHRYVTHKPHFMGQVKMFAYSRETRGSENLDRTKYRGYGRPRMTDYNPIAISPTYNNLVVTSGKNLALDRLFNLSSAVAITSVGVGDNNTAASAGQTGLQGTTNVLIQTADAGTARSSQTVTITSTFGTGVANFNWQECGLFNGNTNNTSTMFNRIVIGAFNKTSAVSIVLQLQITQA